MLRACSMFGLGGIFLWISPKLRGSVQEGIGSVYNGVQMYAPVSYIALGLMVIVFLIISFNRGAQPR